MKALTEPIKELGIYDDLKRALKQKGITGVTGLTESARTVFSYALTEGLRLFVASDPVRAAQIEEEAYLFGREVYAYPARDMMFYQADLSGKMLVRQRMRTIKANTGTAAKRQEKAMLRIRALRWSRPSMH